MTATETFETLLRQVQSSCLNFKIEISPFSAIIYLKKSYIKDQRGVRVLPSPKHEELDSFAIRLRELEEEKDLLKDKLEAAERENQTCNKIIKNLRLEIEQKSNLAESLAQTNNDLKEETKLISSELHNTRLKLTINYEKSSEDIKRNEDLQSENEVLVNKVSELKKKLESAQLTQKQFSTSTLLGNKPLYNVETNNNCEVLTSDNKAVKESYDASKDNKAFAKQPEIDFNNYREKLGEFFENFRDNDEKEPKYFLAMKNVIIKGWDKLHLSLLDVGKFNPSLKEFLAENVQSLEHCKELREWLKEYDKRFEGKFRSNLAIYINKKNYGQ